MELHTLEQSHYVGISNNIAQVCPIFPYLQKNPFFGFGAPRSFKIRQVVSRHLSSKIGTDKKSVCDICNNVTSEGRIIHVMPGSVWYRDNFRLLTVV